MGLLGNRKKCRIFATIDRADFINSFICVDGILQIAAIITKLSLQLLTKLETNKKNKLH